MSENGLLLAALQREVNALQTHLEEMRRAMYGNPSLGQRGLKEDISERINEVEARVAAVHELCDSLVQKDREEDAKKDAMKRIMNFSGASSLLAIITMIAALIALWGNLTGGTGGP